ncbi:hypothetical protein PVAP13_3KG265046 [Panicum virgatum]|uniref:Uncharacterized protein n=1 Tax=Panicum virgatum TaxID=38727 RepID=A0A8T0UUB5_PANVG|nr:hypothetical protein PVAP13_3KG265046 [Panicum virgatum]
MATGRWAWWSRPRRRNLRSTRSGTPAPTSRTRARPRRRRCGAGAATGRGGGSIGAAALGPAVRRVDARGVHAGTFLARSSDNDGSYWLDRPVGRDRRERVKKGDLASAKAYGHRCR